MTASLRRSFGSGCAGTVSLPIIDSAYEPPTTINPSHGDEINVTVSIRRYEHTSPCTI